MLSATFAVSFTVGPGADIDSASLAMPAGAVGFPYSHKFVAKNPAAVQHRSRPNLLRLDR